ncbi:SpaA isopeptide-forming pilin-related protein [Enterococcus sp. BWR-S5]|uniref:SpaA isopeptide-forming pilin-related protein n=1 Tax=Enterococcus sp. BWR-S5 TaxID=2787714 RepID=UPI001921F686|nr:SpaA isopeptide-forming pilin-related protein [Enterococcus sp. BWR-S5]MBL1226500.1 LPXTG cell wall anchor domain-containing protein [Enterococcus sp. BWR-S5]
MRKKKILKTLGMSLFLIGSVAGALLGGEEVEASSILEAPNLTIPSENDSISSDYSFIAQFNEGKTEVKPFGKAKTRILEDDGSLKELGYSSKVLVMNPNEQDSISDIVGSGATYTYVGNYGGKELDMKQTITKLSAPESGKHYGNIMIGLDGISLNTQDYREVEFEYEFFEHGTNKAVAVSGFMTINDVDGNQVFTMSEETSKNVKNIYVSSDTNKISFKNDNGKYTFYDGIGVLVEPDNLDHTFTFTYEKSSKLTLSWGNLARNGVETNNLRPNQINGDYFGYIAKKPVRTELPDPVKKNSDSDETLVDLNTLKDCDEALTYTIVNYVPDEYKDHYYKKYGFEDVLHEIFEVKDVVIKDETGAKRNDYFNLSIDKNSVSYLAKPETLINPDFYNHSYYTEIVAKIRKDADIAALIENGTISVKNTAKVFNDKDTKDSNTTETLLYPVGSITIHKVTNQVVGIKTNVESALSKTNVSFAGLFFTEAFADENVDNGGLIWEKLPQKDVTYEVKASENIVLQNGEIVAEKGHDFGKITTDEAGKATIENLYAGEYVFVEVSAPVGIQVDPTPIIVNLTAENNGKEMTASGNQEDPLQEVKISIPKLFENESGDFVKDSGAVFGLYHAKDFVIDDENVIKADTLVSEIEIKDGIGSYQAAMVRNQQYYIKEISTKEGYQLESKQYIFSYVPDSNEAVHTFELYENGYLEAGIFKEYESINTEEKADSEEQEKTEEKEVPELTEIKNRLIHEDLIHKSILKGDGTRVEHYDLLSDKEKVTFEGQIYIGDHESINSLKFTDEVPDGFSVNSMRVYDSSGKDITSLTDYEVNGQSVAITVKEEAASGLRRTSLTWIVETTYNYDSSHEGKTFENQMLLFVNNEKSESNIVTLTPPVIEIAETSKPAGGSLPNTGEEIQRWVTVIGAVVFLGVISFWYTRKVKQAEEIDKTE